VVAHHGQKRDRRLRERPQRGDGPEDVLEVGAAVVKEVAGVDHGVHVVLDRVLDHATERRQEVRSALRSVVLPVPEVGVPGVDDAGHSPSVTDSTFKSVA
jgi:hypothetical protein